MGDDAAGCLVVRKLRQHDLPKGVKLIEAGTPGLNLLHIMEPGERVIIVDAVSSGMPAGTITVYSEEEMPKPAQMPASAHQLAIPEAIILGRTVQPELMPKSIEIWGIEVDLPLKLKNSLSSEVEKAIDIMAERIADFCRDYVQK